MGLDLGLEMSGLAPCGCLEWDKWACGTIRKNRPNLPLIEDDIRKWNGKRLMERFGLSQEVSVIVGGAPCPSFSTAGRRQSFNDPRGEVMFDFLRIVKELRPAFFVMENVRGILSASIKHRPLALRTRGGLALAPEEEAGSVLRLLHREFKDMGYVVSAELVNAANYGTPQLRERVVFLGSRDGFQVTMPTGDYGPGTGPFLHRWKTLRDALKGLRDSKPEYQSYSENRLKYLRLLTEGQNWRALPQKIQKEAMGGAYESNGGKVGFYRRLAFDKPCPTVPTSPVQKSTCICHPAELRPLSVKEYARVQQFPDDWEFVGSTAAKYKQIGNAVPVGLGFVIGKVLLRYLDNHEEI
jgi:DNA (cytosine-5)-methyltransferase 1